MAGCKASSYNICRCCDSALSNCHFFVSVISSKLYTKAIKPAKSSLETSPKSSFACGVPPTLRTAQGNTGCYYPVSSLIASVDRTMGLSSLCAHLIPALKTKHGISQRQWFPSNLEKSASLASHLRWLTAWSNPAFPLSQPYFFPLWKTGLFTSSGIPSAHTQPLFLRLWLGCCTCSQALLYLFKSILSLKAKPIIFSYMRGEKSDFKLGHGLSTIVLLT